MKEELYQKKQILLVERMNLLSKTNNKEKEND